MPRGLESKMPHSSVTEHWGAIDGAVQGLVRGGSWEGWWEQAMLLWRGLLTSTGVCGVAVQI